MTEPTLERGESWEAFLKRKVAEKDTLDVAFESGEWWEREQMKSDRRALYFEIDCAYRHLGINAMEIDW